MYVGQSNSRCCFVLFCVSWCWFALGEDFVNKSLGVVIFVESRVQVLAFVKLRSFSVTVRVNSVEKCFDAANLVLCRVIAVKVQNLICMCSFTIDFRL